MSSDDVSNFKVGQKKEFTREEIKAWLGVDLGDADATCYTTITEIDEENKIVTLTTTWHKKV